MTPKTGKRPSPWLLLVVGLVCVGSVVGLIVGISIPLTQQNNKQATQTATQFEKDQATANAGATQEAQATEAIATATANATALLSLAANLNAHDPGPPYSPYLVGKLLVINQTTHQIDTEILEDPHSFSLPIPYLLPADMLATTPDQIGTILLLDCRKVEVGSDIIKGIPFYQRSCTMTIIDRRRALVVDKHDFTGPPPPSYSVCLSPCSDGISGDYPATAMVQYLKGLPRK